MRESLCTDQVVGDILSGWRYDISSLSPVMRTDYEQHLHECTHCRNRQRRSRTVDVLLMAVSTLSIGAFLMAALVVRRLEAATHLTRLHVYWHHTAMTISLEAVAVTGLAISMLLWVLVAIATPLPGFLSGVVQERIPDDLRERFTRHA